MSVSPFRIIAADHTGITVSNLERSHFGGMFSVLNSHIPRTEQAKGRSKSRE
jgi:hypothetical protein